MSAKGFPGDLTVGPGDSWKYGGQEMRQGLGPGCIRVWVGSADSEGLRKRVGMGSGKNTQGI